VITSLIIYKLNKSYINHTNAIIFMVLESLVGPVKAETKPMRMFWFGMLFSSIAVILSLWIFKEQSSLIMVFLTVFACIPLIYKTIKLEEQKDDKIIKENVLLKEHGKALSYLMFLFLGFVVSLSLWYVFLPAELTQTLFSAQLNTIKSINSQIAGNAVATSYFYQIFTNNMKVLLFCIFFSFFYGAGAIFILTWNASVISGAIGTFIRNNISGYAGSFGFTSLAGYFQIFSFGFFKYMTHGVFEIVAYFAGGLAGGIISVAVIKHEVDTKEFRHVLKDSLDLIILSIAILLIGVIVEVFITPSLF